MLMIDLAGHEAAEVDQDVTVLDRPEIEAVTLLDQDMSEWFPDDVGKMWWIGGVRSSYDGW